MTEAERIVILDSVWFTNHIGIVGVVAAERLDEKGNKKWVAYIGSGNGVSEINDEQVIAQWGHKLTVRQANAFFPKLNIKDYKFQDHATRNDQRNPDNQNESVGSEVGV